MRSLAAVLLVATLAVAAAAEGVVVRLRPSVRVEAPEVTVGDLASVSGPERAVRAVRAVVVVEGVKPGGGVRVAADQVQLALREAGFDPRAVTVTGAREVLVRRVDRSAAVRKGSAVRVVAAVGVVRVTTNGVALEAGDVGDVIRVRVLATRREVLTRVARPGLVEVAF